MNYRIIFRLIGNMFKLEAFFMVFPTVITFVYDEPIKYKTAFLWAVLILSAAGFALSFIKVKVKKFAPRDAFAAASLSWILFSVLGGLPYYFGGALKNIADCCFESIAGFTTTGTTLIKNVETLSKGILFWRGFSVWIGGVGVLIFMVAVMPSMNASSINLLRAETTGISSGRIVPKIRETAKIIYIIYICMTVLIALLLIISGMPVYDSFIHAFTTAGSGGFSTMNGGVGAYGNRAAEIIITVFMFLVGISFTLYFHMSKGNFKQLFKDEETRVYFAAVILSVAVMTANVSGMCKSVWDALRFSSFQVASVVSTTGFIPPHSVQMPTLSQFIILCLMFAGCCAGSTGGGIKIVRIILLVKTAIAEIGKIIHPKSIKAITINGKKIDDETITKTAMFFFLYFVTFFAAVFFISFEGKDMTLTMSSVIGMLSNTGAGIADGGLYVDFSSFSALSKIVFSLCMLIGRLEFFPVLILFRGSFWFEKKVKIG